MLTVKPAAAVDEREVVALWRACNLVASYNDPGADFRFAKAGPSSEVLIAVDDTGEIAGSVMVGHDGHRGWLSHVAARPASRGTGVGRRMARAAEQRRRPRGAAKARRPDRETNTPGVSSRERHGSAVAPRGAWTRFMVLASRGGGRRPREAMALPAPRRP